jgi:hypothetical protein
MRQGTHRNERSDQLAWLVLRVIDERSPCTEACLLALVATGDENAARAQTKFGLGGYELVGGALQKLRRLGFVRLNQTQIDVTDEGRRFLRELPAAALRLDERSSSTSAVRGDTAPSALQTRAWARFIALLARYPAGALVGRIQTRIIQIYEIVLEVWKRDVAPKMATAPIDAAKHLAEVSGAYARTLAIVSADWIRKSRALPLKLWQSGYPSLKAKLSGLSPVVLLTGGLLVVALSTAGGVALLSTKHPENSAESIKHPENSRESPISWSYDGQDPLKRSIFVTRVSDGTTWIEGLSIRGENKSSRTLTGVQGIVKWDSGERMNLTVSVAGSEGTRLDAQTVPAGDEFTLGYKFQSDGSDQQPSVPAKAFLAANGGVIFKVRYKVADVQTTLIEYLSPSSLKSQFLGSADTPQAKY